MNTDATGSLPVIEESLREIYIIIRPEEKYDVERALCTIVAPFYVAINALGRGAEGGLSYQGDSKRRGFPWRRPRHQTSFLPKLVFHLIVPESLVDRITGALSAVLKARGGPDDCGLGVAIVIPVECEVAIGDQGFTSARSTPEPFEEAQAV